MKLKELQGLIELRNIPCSDENALMLERYMDYILEKNKEINLTAIKDRDEYMVRMIFDSALPLSLTSFANKKVLDIGTGAGYPGTVIATLTNAEVDLLDSTKKKLDVIKGFKDKSFNVINARAEDYARSHPEEYDLVVARAVSDLSILLELALPLLKVGGYFIALKGPNVDKEINDAKSAFKKLHAHTEKKEEIVLPLGETRINLLIKKDNSTPKKYPRPYNEIKDKPL